MAPSALVAKPDRNRQIVLAALPDGPLAPNHFAMVETAVPSPGDGQLLVAVRMISVDAANRAWMQGQTYRDPLSGGQVMAGLGIGEIVAGGAGGFAVGDRVFGDFGWQDFVVADPAALCRQRTDVPVERLLSLYGTSTLAAAVGLDIGGLRAGDTVAVSAAGGSVGVMVGQIAKLAGARVVGFAGGADKCRWLVDEIGYDAAIDHRGPDLRAAMRDALPTGIDLYFDNVGGDLLERCLFAMRNHGRIVCCGAVASYDGGKPMAGPRGVPGLIVTRRLTMRGFVVSDHDADRPMHMTRIEQWVARGLRGVEDIVDGLACAPTALIDQLAGRSRGKKMVRLAP